MIFAVRLKYSELSNDQSDDHQLSVGRVYQPGLAPVRHVASYERIYGVPVWNVGILYEFCREGIIHPHLM